MLVSGVRSSCETMLTSCDFSRSLWRSSSFSTSSSRFPCSSERAIALKALVRAWISAAPCSGRRVERSPAATRLAPSATVRTGAAMPRTTKMAKSARSPAATVRAAIPIWTA